MSSTTIYWNERSGGKSEYFTTLTEARENAEQDTSYAAYDRQDWVTIHRVGFPHYPQRELVVVLLQNGMQAAGEVDEMETHVAQWAKDKWGRIREELK